MRHFIMYIMFQLFQLRTGRMDITIGNVLTPNWYSTEHSVCDVSLLFCVCLQTW